MDAYVEGLAVARLSQPDVADLLRPPPRPGADAAGLRAEARKLRERKAGPARAVRGRDIDEAALAGGVRVIRDRLAVIESQLAASDQPDPLAEFRGPARRRGVGIAEPAQEAGHRPPADGHHHPAGGQAGARVRPVHGPGHLAAGDRLISGWHRLPAFGYARG